MSSAFNSDPQVICCLLEDCRVYAGFTQGGSLQGLYRLRIPPPKFPFSSLSTPVPPFNLPVKLLKVTKPTFSHVSQINLNIGSLPDLLYV